MEPSYTDLVGIISFNNNRKNIDAIDHKNIEKRNREFDVWNQPIPSDSDNNYIFSLTALFIGPLSIIIFLFSRSFDIDEYGKYIWTNLSYFYIILACILISIYGVYLMGTLTQFT